MNFFVGSVVRDSILRYEGLLLTVLELMWNAEFELIVVSGN